jgi:hypothetical protein
LGRRTASPARGSDAKAAVRHAARAGEQERRDVAFQCDTLRCSPV